MRALDRAKHIIQVLDERSRILKQPAGQSGGEAAGDNVDEEAVMPQVGQKRQRNEWSHIKKDRSRHTQLRNICQWRASNKKLK